MDALCIVDTTNGLDLVSIVTYDEGETSDIIVLVENIDTESYYCIKSAVSDFYIGFQINTTKTNTDESTTPSSLSPVPLHPTSQGTAPDQG